MSCLVHLIELVFGLFISPFIWPFVIVISLTNWFVRVFLTFFVFKERYEFPSSSFDTVFFHPSWISSTVLLALYSPDPVNLDHERGMWTAILKSKEEDGSFTYAKLKKRFVKKCGYVVLEKMYEQTTNSDIESVSNSKYFNIEEHVKIYQGIQSQHKSYFTEDEFQQKILPSLLKPLDNSKPQWEYLIFPAVQRPNGDLHSVRVFRWNHAYMDGASVGLLVGERFFDQKPGQEPDFFFHPKQKRSVPHLYALFAKLWTAFNFPLIFSVGLLMHLPFVKSKIGNGLFSSKNIVNPKLKLTAPIKLQAKLEEGRKVQIQANLIPVFVETINEVLPNNKESSVICSIPLAMTPYPNSKPRNQFVALEATLKLRQKEHFKATNPKLLGLDFLFGDILIKYFGWLLAIALDNMSFEQCVVDLNNVPFLRSKGTVNGAKIEEIGAWGGLLRPQGLGLCIIAYGDEVFLTTTSVEGDLNEETVNTFSRSFAAGLFLFPDKEDNERTME